MLNNFLKGIYFRIFLSRLYSHLRSTNELYLKDDKNEYVKQMGVLYSNLLEVPDAYSKNFSDNRVASIYSIENDFLLRMEQLITSRRVNELSDLSGDIKLFLDKVYDAIITSRASSKRSGYSAAIGGIVVLVFLLLVAYSPLKKRYHTERKQYELLVNEDFFKQKTLEDIFQLKEALDKYYRDKKSYPKSSGGWDAIVAIYGQSKEDWIPGLVPDYIKELPRDPRKSDDSSQQYMYNSNGADYKLIAHSPLGMGDIISTYPELVDPRRPSWAFGVWTEAAKNW